jgi:valyl-tRNA synthetase
MNTEDMADGDFELSSADLWIRSRLDHAVRAVHGNFASYRLDLAAQAIYEFTWHEFCDWYLELSKPILQSDDSSEAEKRGTRRTLVEVLECLLRLLHPIMPFITEEIWQRVGPLAGVEGPTVMLQPYPAQKDYPADPHSEQELDWVRGFVLGIRQIKGEMNIPPGRVLPVVLQGAGKTDIQWLAKHQRLLERLARLESVTVLGEDESAPPAATALLGEMRILVPMAGLIDVSAEIARLTRQRDKLKSELDRCTKKLANENFVNNAPAAVVEKERARIAEFSKSMEQLDDQLQVIEALGV